ncbi:MAG: hypothetical protein M0010_17605 [Actinomycetota bacterium]|nr:hypothetical protein [Actinomycetota bacterium]
MTSGTPDAASVVRALSDAGVLFVVVGDPAPDQPLRLVVSRHPTNLDALGRALDRLEATLRAQPAPTGEREREDEARRIGDATGTLALSTPAGDVDLVFGGARRSLYADALSHAQDRVLCGLHVRWTGELPTRAPEPRATSRMLSRRLFSLAEALAHRIERRSDAVERETQREG